MRKTNAKTTVTVNKANNTKKEGITMRKTVKANEFEAIMEAINGIAMEIADIRKDVDELKAEEKSVKKSTPKTTSKGTAKKSSAKTTATKKTSNKAKKSSKKSAPATYTEAIASRYTAEEREAYGVAAREIREEMMAENKKMVKTVKGKKVYDENYYVGKKWTREFNRRMKERGFSVK